MNTALIPGKNFEVGQVHSLGKTILSKIPRRKFIVWPKTPENSVESHMDQSNFGNLFETVDCLEKYSPRLALKAEHNGTNMFWQIVGFLFPSFHLSFVQRKSQRNIPSLWQYKEKKAIVCLQITDKGRDEFLSPTWWFALTSQIVDNKVKN